MKSFLYGILTGGALMAFCFALGLCLLIDKKDIKEKDVKVTQVSGEKITHTDFDYGSDSITFKTEADGKGVITTEIPKDNIPEARYWMHNTNAVMLELLLVEQRMYGVSYLKRWGNFSAGGGVLFSEKKFEGVKVQTEYWFSL